MPGNAGNSIRGNADPETLVEGNGLDCDRKLAKELPAVTL